MTLYHTTSVIIDQETMVGHRAHHSHLSGELIGTVTVGDHCERLTVTPHTLADLDRLVDALRDLRADWIALAERAAMEGQPTLLDDLESMAS